MTKRATRSIQGTAPAPLPTVGDAGPAVVVPFPVTLRPVTGSSPQSLTVTTDGPIDAPIVILIR